MVGPRTRPKSDREGNRVKKRTVSSVKEIIGRSYLDVCRKGEVL